MASLHCAQSLMRALRQPTGQATFEDVTEAIGMDAVSTTIAAGCAGELVAAQVIVAADPPSQQDSRV